MARVTVDTVRMLETFPNGSRMAHPMVFLSLLSFSNRYPVFLWKAVRSKEFLSNKTISLWKTSSIHLIRRAANLNVDSQNDEYIFKYLRFFPFLRGKRIDDVSISRTRLMTRKLITSCMVGPRANEHAGKRFHKTKLDPEPPPCGRPMRSFLWSSQRCEKNRRLLSNKMLTRVINRLQLFKSFVNTLPFRYWLNADDETWLLFREVECSSSVRPMFLVRPN